MNGSSDSITGIPELLTDNPELGLKDSVVNQAIWNRKWASNDARRKRMNTHQAKKKAVENRRDHWYSDMDKCIQPNTHI